MNVNALIKAHGKLETEITQPNEKTDYSGRDQSWYQRRKTWIKWKNIKEIIVCAYKFVYDMKLFNIKLAAAQFYMKRDG